MNGLGLVDLDDEKVAHYRRSVSGKRSYLVVKRVIDVVGSAGLLVLLSPLLLVAAIAVVATSPGPALYRAKRCSLASKPFGMLKFRSMRVSTPEEEAAFAERIRQTGVLPKTADDPRITPLGRWMRRRSVDELPQLFNILVGEMSFVGPRPMMEEMLPPYPRFDQARHLIRPGLTGLWQIRDRANDGHPGFMWNHDLEYIENVGFATDVDIVLTTAWQVLRYAGGR
ncbi:MAG: sugar transferase [Sphingomonas sp.]